MKQLFRAGWVQSTLAFILAAALGVAAVIVIIEVIAVAAHHNPVVVPWTTWYRWANRTRWDQLVIQIWSAILIAIGVVLLALELKRPRVTRLLLRSQHDATDAAMTRFLALLAALVVARPVALRRPRLAAGRVLGRGVLALAHVLAVLAVFGIFHL